VDVEVIELAAAWLGQAEWRESACRLNSLRRQVPARYREALRDHFRPHIDEMCEDSAPL